MTYHVAHSLTKIPTVAPLQCGNSDTQRWLRNNAALLILHKSTC